jgi:hypothetical protein
MMETRQHNPIHKYYGRLPNDEQELIEMVYDKGKSVRAYASLKKLNYMSVLRKRERILNKPRSLL